MKFTIELKTFTKMIKMVSKRMPGQKRADDELRLSACAARVFVEANQTVAGIEALVLEDGQCVLNRKRFLSVLGTYKEKKILTIEADAGWLKIGSFSIAVRNYSPQARAPGEFQVFPVTDLSILFPDKKQPPEQKLAAAVPEARQARPSICKQEGSFPIAEDEMYLVVEVLRFVRRFCALPKVTPAQLAGLAHALFALERMPRITKGVDVECNVAVRTGTEDDHSELWMTFHISEGGFNVGTDLVNCDPVVGRDHKSTTIYEVNNIGYRSIKAGDEDAWVQVFDWIHHVDGLLKENNPEELKLFVADDSTPGCM